MFVIYEEREGVKWRLKAVETEPGAKRSVGALRKKLAKRSKRALAITYGYMSAEAWANRVVPMKKVRNLMTGAEMEIPADTPGYMDPSTETYWSM